MRELHPALSTI